MIQKFIIQIYGLYYKKQNLLIDHPFHEKDYTIMFRIIFYFYKMNLSVSKKIPFLLSFLFYIISFQLAAQTNSETNFRQNDLEVKLSSIIIKNVETEISINILDSKLAKEFNNKEITVALNDSLLQLIIINGKASFDHKFTKKEEINIKAGSFDFTKEFANETFKVFKTLKV